MKTNTDASGGVLLGIEGGGTRLVALAVEETGGVLRRIEGGPANVCLLSDRQLLRQFKSIRAQMPAPRALGIGLAGARTDADKNRVREAARQVWPGVPCYATNDLETGLMAEKELPGVKARVLVLSGTGSCCFGRTPRKSIRVGGWGHILGDHGSGYDIALQGLKAVVRHYDSGAGDTVLAQKILRAVQLNDPEDLVAWIQEAGKNQVASVAVAVFEAAKAGDKAAREILGNAADILAEDGVRCAGLLVKRKDPVQFVLAGSVLLKQPAFARQVGNKLKALWPRAYVTALQRESAWGGVELARVAAKLPPGKIARPVPMSVADAASPPADLQKLVLSPTETRNPRSMNLDKLSPLDGVTLMLSEESRTPEALLKEREKIAAAVELVVGAFKRGGRLFYVGAGTSGRLGVLDASECPPTFNVSPEMVQGIMAGGQRALWDSVEGAEDDAAAGALAVRFRGVSKKDVLLGIAASGRTPFVWGALREAQQRGAATVLLAFNPHLTVPRGAEPDLVITPDLGPEVLTGSTRLKAGTATKLVLNAITTIAMVQLGKVKSNLMIDVKASNIKLQDRAARILQQLSGTNYGEARAALAASAWNIQRAWDSLKAK